MLIHDFHLEFNPFYAETLVINIHKVHLSCL